MVSKAIRALDAELFGTIHEPPKKKPKHDHTRIADKQAQSAWADPEDEELVINAKQNRKLRHLRQNFDEDELNAAEFIKRQRKHYKQTIGVDDDWTKPPTQSDDEEDDEEQQDKEAEDDDISNDKKQTQKKNKLEIFQRSVRMTAIKDGQIENNEIKISELGAINSKHKHNSVITVCEFDIEGKLLMTAGLDKTVCLYSMEGTKNELLKRIFIKDLPIRCARFIGSSSSGDDSEIIMTGRRYFLYSFNLMSFQLNRISKLVGRDERSWECFEVSPNGVHIVFVGLRGSLVVVSKHTKKPMKTISISQQIVSIKFNVDGDYLYVLTQNAAVYVFDMKTFRCVDKMVFDGIVKATCFDLFARLNLIAIGCSSGVVAVYHCVLKENAMKKMVGGSLLMDGDDVVKKTKEDEAKSGGAVEALYNVENLVTCIHGVEFNHDGQLLVLWSKTKKQAIRLVHVQSGKVYANWPRDRGLSFVYKAKFSPHSGYLAVGNDIGQVKMMRLHFYGAQ